MLRAFKFYFSLIIFVYPLILGVSLASAETTQIYLTPQVSIPGSDFQSQQPKLIKNDTSLICDYIVAVYKYGIAIVGVFAVLAIAIGGVLWIVSAGNSGMIGQGKDWIISGILGLVLALGSFILLATINKDLVTCQVGTIPNIARQNSSIKQAQQESGTVYGKPGLTDKKVAKSIDSSGKYQCCIIKGDLKGSGWIADTSVERCATYEATNATVAQPECNNFYDNYGVKGTEKNALTIRIGSFLGPAGAMAGAIIGAGGVSNFTDNMLKLDTRESPPIGSTALGTKNTSNSAVVYEGKCWENSETKNTCMGADNPDFCKNHDIGTACLVSNGGAFGYCGESNGTKSCFTCLKHCDPCAENYQCPNQTADPQAWIENAKKDPKLLEFGNPATICGKQMYSLWRSNSNDCASGKCDKEFGGGCP